MQSESLCGCDGSYSEEVLGGACGTLGTDVVSKNESNSGKLGFVVLKVVCNTLGVLRTGLGTSILTILLF